MCWTTKPLHVVTFEDEGYETEEDVRVLAASTGQYCILHSAQASLQNQTKREREEKKRKEKETHQRKRCTPIASCSFLLSFVHRLLFLPFQLGNISRCMPGIRALFVYVHQFFSLSFLSNLIFLLYPPSASSSVLPGPPFSRWSFARCHVLFGC